MQSIYGCANLVYFSLSNVLLHEKYMGKNTISTTTLNTHIQPPPLIQPHSTTTTQSLPLSTPTQPSTLIQTPPNHHHLTTHTQPHTTIPTPSNYPRSTNPTHPHLKLHISLPACLSQQALASTKTCTN